MYVLAICLVDYHLLSLSKLKCDLPLSLIYLYHGWQISFPEAKSLFIIRQFYQNCCIEKETIY